MQLPWRRDCSDFVKYFFLVQSLKLNSWGWLVMFFHASVAARIFFVPHTTYICTFIHRYIHIGFSQLCLHMKEKPSQKKERKKIPYLTIRKLMGLKVKTMCDTNWIFDFYGTFKCGMPNRLNGMTTIWNMICCFGRYVNKLAYLSRKNSWKAQN